MEKQFWDDIYKRDSIIGNKDFQTLYRAKQNLDNDSFVTIKEYLIKKGEDSNNKKVKELYEREIELMKDLLNSNCENFVKLIDCKEDIYDERDYNFYYIIREYCFGNLEEFITMNENKLEPRFIQLIMKQLNNAFKILRDKNIIHRNIKPSNILFCYKEDTNFIMKLSGLNYYKKGNNSCPSINNNNFLNPPLNNEDEKYDLWSIGIIMYFMYFGEYKNTNKISEINDKDLKDLIDKYINSRISWNDYFNHPFFKNIYHDYNKDDKYFNIVKELIDYGNTCLKYGEEMRGYLVQLTETQVNDRSNKLNEQYKEWENKIKNIKELSEKVNELKKIINIPK